MKSLPGNTFNVEPAANIRNICILRLAVSAAIFSATVSASLVDTPSESTFYILIILSAQLLVTASSLILNKKGILASEKHFFIQLLLDIFFISLFIYSAGGATNPFVTYFLVPLSIAAATLPQRYSIIITSMTILSYTLLLFFYQPFSLYQQDYDKAINSVYQAPIAEHDHHGNIPTHRSIDEPAINQALDPHYLGMWINFLISALLINWFILRMAQAIRKQEKSINQQHEQQIYDEQILSVATIAASTAHELGTPINSLALLIGEFSKTDHKFTAQQIDDLNLMQSQIKQCNKSLRKLIGTAQQTQAGQPEVISCKELINNCLNEWQPLRHEVNIKKPYLQQSFDVMIRCDHSISQAVINLLNNAANISPSFVSIDMQSTRDIVRIIIQDHGSGVPATILEQYGQQPINNGRLKNSLGLGLFVSHASIRRHQGQLILRNQYDKKRAQTGAEAIIQLPLLDENGREYE